MMSAITMQRKQKTRSTATYLDASRLNAVATKKHPPPNQCPPAKS